MGTLAASITPREEVDEMLIAVAPQKQPKHTISTSPPTVDEDKSLWVVRFDGSARTKRKSGIYSAITRKLPDWKIVTGAAEYETDLTVNDAEHRGLLPGLDLLDDQTRASIIICGDYTLVIRQIREEIDCKAPDFSCYVIVLLRN